MTEYLYSDLLNLAIAQANVDLLVKLWSDTPDLNKEYAKYIERSIEEALPSLSKFYDLPPARDFKEFVENYDFKMALEECGEGVDFCLCYFAKKGNLRMVKLLIKKGATNLDGALRETTPEIAAYLRPFYDTLYYGRSSAESPTALVSRVINSIVLKDPELDYKLGLLEEHGNAGLYNTLLYRAAFIGDRKLVDFAIERGARDKIRGALKAVSGGHEDLMYYLTRNKFGLGPCLEEAIVKEQFDIARNLQYKVEDYDKYIINAVAKSGSLKIIDKYFNPKDVHLTMTKAIVGRNIANIEYMLDKGIPIRSFGAELLAQTGEEKFFKLIEVPSKKHWILLQSSAAQLGRLSTLKYSIEHGIKVSFQVMMEAVRFGFIDVIKFLFEHYRPDETRVYYEMQELRKVAKEGGNKVILDYFNNLP